MEDRRKEDAHIRDEAAGWHVASASEEMDWAAFAEWLDRDQRHRDAYDDIALLDQEIEAGREAIVTMIPANDVEEEQPAVAQTNRRRWWAGGGVALAACLALIGMPQWMPVGPATTSSTYRTAEAGRTIALPDGSSIALGGKTELAVADGGTSIRMREGVAHFDIRHDPSRQMVIDAGSVQISDIGTQFDLVVGPKHTTVAVGEGRLSVTPRDGSAVMLTAGHRLDLDEAKGDATIRPTSTESVGSWREGRLVYDNSPLALVAIDIGRYSGQRISVDPQIADLRMSGVLNIGDGSKLVSQVTALLPIRADRQGGGVRLVAAR
jgi:transmembrane sensor